MASAEDDGGRLREEEGGKSPHSSGVEAGASGAPPAAQQGRAGLRDEWPSCHRVGSPVEAESQSV